MTTGAASKLTKKLLSKGLLIRYQKLENRKEVYFRLTERGETLYEAVSALRKNLIRRDDPVFSELSDTQYEVILQFVRRYREHLDSLTRRGTSRRSTLQER